MEDQVTREQEQAVKKCKDQDAAKALRNEFERLNAAITTARRTK